MSSDQIQLAQKTQQLLHGPLKHVRAAQTCEPSNSAGSVCGFVWTDTNRDGIQDPNETGIPGLTVTLGTATTLTTTTDSSGFYYFYNVNTFPQDVTVEIPQGMEASPSNAGGDDAKDSDGFVVGGDSVASVDGCGICDADFGFFPAVDEDGVVPTPCDFLTSGGFVINDAGKKVTFGIHGGCKNGEFWGHLNVVDHATGYHINSTDITGYLVPTKIGNPYAREICGLATTNKPSESSVAFRVRLIDNGEPGSLDLFGIRLSTNYHVSTRLLSALKPGGGNIQLHDPNPSTTIAPGTSPQCWGVPSPD